MKFVIKSWVNISHVKMSVAGDGCMCSATSVSGAGIYSCEGVYEPGIYNIRFYNKDKVVSHEMIELKNSSETVIVKEHVVSELTGKKTKDIVYVCILEYV